MIHYIVGRNLGHLNPCVANLSKFMELSSEPVKLFAFTHTHAWLRSNFPQGDIHRFINVQKRVDILLNANLVMHDWRDEVQKLKNERAGKGPIIGGIYHSEMSITSEDTDWTKKFKEQIRIVSQNSTDIFFISISHNQKKFLNSQPFMYLFRSLPEILQWNRSK